jgi:hypothetical protein
MKKLLQFIFPAICLVTMGVAAVQAQSLTTNLLFYLPVEGNAHDWSGNGHHGTIVNATLVPDRLGNPNSAFAFNATQGVLLSNAAALRPQLPMSVSFWAWFDILGNTAFANNFTDSMYTGMWMGIGVDGKVNLNFGDGGTTSPGFRRSKNSNATAGAGAWHHYVGVIRSTMDMDIYIDCVDAGGVYSGSGGSIFYNTNPGELGASAGAMYPNGVVYMTGKMDEIAFWDRALTPTDVLGICNGLLDKLVVAREDAWAGEAKLSPNPVASGQTQVKLVLPLGTKAMKAVQLLDVQGKLLDTITIDGQHELYVPTAGLAAGSYYVRIVAEDGQGMVKRLQIQ